MNAIAATWRIHQPGLYLIKYCSMASPEDMAKGIDGCYGQKVQNPPARFQESDFFVQFFDLHGLIAFLHDPRLIGRCFLYNHYYSYHFSCPNDSKRQLFSGPEDYGTEKEKNLAGKR